MYLTSISLKNAASPEERFRLAYQIQKARKAYENLDNEQTIHRMVCDMAGGTKRADKNLLYRKMDPCASTLHIQSESPLDHSMIERLGYDIIRETDLQPIMDQVECGDILNMNAKYAPTRQDGNGKKRSLRDPEDRRIWLERKMSESGIHLLAFSELHEDHITFSHDRKQNMDSRSSFINGFTYRILGMVTNKELFENAAKKGIGRGKAYGCGLTVFQKADQTGMLSCECKTLAASRA